MSGRRDPNFRNSSTTLSPESIKVSEPKNEYLTSSSEKAYNFYSYWLYRKMPIKPDRIPSNYILFSYYRMCSTVNQFLLGIPELHPCFELTSTTPTSTCSHCSPDYTVYQSSNDATLIFMTSSQSRSNTSLSRSFATSLFWYGRFASLFRCTKNLGKFPVRRNNEQ